tara:strand:- start:593 stop:1123 length:531 start_codon:yes stop_codon:yes gene_type:complete
VATAIITALAALSAVFLTNYQNIKRLEKEHELRSKNDKQKLLTERGEELYELLDKWLDEFTYDYLRLNLLLKNEITYDQYHERVISEGSKGIPNFGRIEILVYLYFPDILDNYNKLLTIRKERNRVVFSHKRNYNNRNMDGTKFIKPLEKLHLDLDKAGENLKEKIVEAVKSLENR